jgi:hypothetical protein
MTVFASIRIHVGPTACVYEHAFQQFPAVEVHSLAIGRDLPSKCASAQYWLKFLLPFFFLEGCLDKLRR